jgi:hypothetical protein
MGLLLPPDRRSGALRGWTDRKGFEIGDVKATENVANPVHWIQDSRMPIRAQHRWLYPIDWAQISIAIRFGRAKGRCEQCGRPHGREVTHLGDGRWWDEEAKVWRNGRGRALAGLVELDDQSRLTTKVFLAAAHLDHDPGNNRLRNLRALCQRCHMLHDREEHRRRRWLTYRARKALGDLFLGTYPTPW